MPGNAFIKFTKNGSKSLGESLQTSHPGTDGWCEIVDWGVDIESETNFLKGTGAAVGVATPSVVSFTHTFDKSSPVIMGNIIMGTSFDTVVIHMMKATGAANGQPEVYFGAKFTNAFITKVSSKGAEDGSVTQDIEFVFKAMALGYKKQENTGKLASSAAIFGWNVAERSSVSGITLALDPKKD